MISFISFNLVKSISNLLNSINVHEKFKSIQNVISVPLANTVSLFLLLITLWVLYKIIRPLFHRLIVNLLKKTDIKFIDYAIDVNFFKWISLFIIGILSHFFILYFFGKTSSISIILVLLSKVYLLVIGYFIFSSLLEFLLYFLNRTKIADHLNLIIINQIIKLLFVLFLILLGVAMLLNKPPLVIVSGLGVLASVLMLVFKDVILGFIAGIRLSSNKMLTVGDWLEIPTQNVDGQVLEIGLTTIKIKNWDNTITSVPSYSLTSTPFKNWRGMSDSTGRRIKRSILIDIKSISFCSLELIDKLKNVIYISDYISKKQDEIERHNLSLKDNQLNKINFRSLTNIGIYRIYIENYLKNHPDINQSLTIIVRQLDIQDKGLPIEIYCFSFKKEWKEYENIQSDIFDHLLAITPEFNLEVFQYPTKLDYLT